MDLNNPGVRRFIIDEIESDENKRRKAEHQKRALVYNDYQRDYVLKMLVNEFSPKTVSEMRTCTSINLTRKIIEEMASIYKRKPEREYSDDITPDQEAGIELIYQSAKADTILKRANQKYKLHEQCALQVIPKNGQLTVRLLSPHQYDVIPDPVDPEEAFAYVVSSFDKTNLESDTNGGRDLQGNYYGSKNETKSDGVNQKIADQDDWVAPKRYVVWTKDTNLVMDENGNILESNPNPIQELPFIDVAGEKEFEYWVRRGSGIVEFNLDFLTVLSDVVNTSRLQSYSQAVIVAERLPESVTVGPQNILFLPLDSTRPEVKPSFQFVSPNPDLKASLELQDKLISYFLTSKGISPKTISGDASSEKFASGLERLLAMIERFEASQSDVDLFIDVENKLYSLLRAWYTAAVGTDALDDNFNFGVWPEESTVSVKFLGPEVVQTETDKEDSVIKRLDAGLISKEEAISELRGVTLEEASTILKSIDQVTITGA